VYPLIVILTGGFFPAPRLSTISGGILMPGRCFACLQKCGFKFHGTFLNSI
jgi:hypothetical protein